MIKRNFYNSHRFQIRDTTDAVKTLKEFQVSFDILSEILRTNPNADDIKCIVESLPLFKNQLNVIEEGLVFLNTPFDELEPLEQTICDRYPNSKNGK